MNINSSSFSVSSSLSAGNSNAITGLASGIDTDSVVEQMLSGQKKKIEAQEAKQQQTEWKQEMYRECIDSINNLVDNFLNTNYDASATNNVASSKFWDAVTASASSGGAVRVDSTTAGAQAGDMSVIVKQLATTSKITGNTTATSKSIQGTSVNNIKAKLDKTLAFTVNGTSVKVDLNNITTQDKMVAAINTAISDAGIKNVTADIKKGRLNITSTDTSTKLALDKGSSTELALKMTGFTTASVSEDAKDDADTVIGVKLAGSSAVNTESTNLSFSVALDGVEKTIEIDPSGLLNGDDNDKNMKNIQEALNAELKKAFGTKAGENLVKIEYDENNDSFSMNLNYGDEDGHTLSIYNSNASILGFTAGDSTSFGTSQTLDKLGISGDTAFSINGVDFRFTSDTTISSVMSTINSSDAGVKLSYSSFSGKFTMEATSSGAAFDIDVAQTQGDFFGKIFGVSNGQETVSAVATKPLKGNAIAGATDAVIEGMTEPKLTMTVDGTEHTFSMAKNDTGYTKDEVLDEFNSWLTSEFGGKISYDKDSGKLNITQDISNPTSVSFATAESSDDDAKKTDLALVLGFSGKANGQSNSETLKDIFGDSFTGQTTDGKDIGDLKLSEIAAGVEIKLKDDTGVEHTTKLSYINGHLELSANVDKDTTFNLANTGTGLEQIFGNSITVGSGKVDFGSNKVSGQDAELEINGTKTSRSSNTFTIDGITMTATKVSESSEVNGQTVYEETKITSEQDIDSIVEGVKKFVDEYNKMLKTITDYTGAEKTYNDYSPLTPDQEDEMSESQIEKWTEKAKGGLLRNDTLLNAFTSTIRTLMYTKPDSSNYALYQIGIETGDYKENGQLHLDEEALRKALATDIESVKNLFTDKKDGIAIQLKKTCDGYAKKSYGAAAGLLVQRAGAEGASENSNELSNELTTIKNKISDLQKRYESMRTRYLKQFSTMETMLSNANSQSSWLSQMLGS